MSLKEKSVLVYFGTFAVVFILLAVVGGVRNYSPVPYWDMWHGYLEFYTRVTSGDISAWWAQHNEHRIILSKIIFWIDLAWLNGEGWFLVIIIYFLVFAVFLLFHVIVKEQLPGNDEGFSRKIFSLLSLIIIFSWIQSTNFVWGFQSQFILAQLLPLLAFYLLHKSFVSSKNEGNLFLLSCLVGTLSTGSMANGVLTLPLMVALSLLLRMQKKYTVTLVLLSILTLFAYFYNYTAPQYHGSIKDSLLNTPFDFIQYLLLYLGGPFYYITGRGSFIVTQLAGVFLIVTCVGFALKYIKKPSESSFQLSLLLFLLYAGCSAFAIAGSRLFIGLESATDSRFQTPVLMSWTAVLILYSPVISNKIKCGSNRVILLLMIVPLLLLPQQIKAIDSQQDQLFERLIAALALELGIKDQEQILNVYFSAEATVSIAKSAVEDNLSIFNSKLIKDVNQVIGVLNNEPATAICKGRLAQVRNIDGVEDYLRVSGWLYQPDTGTVPDFLYIMNDRNKIIGYALTGKSRPDISDAVSKDAGNAGFKGYLLAKDIEETVFLRGGSGGCELEVEVPLPVNNVKMQ